MACMLFSFPLGVSASSLVTWDTEESFTSPKYYDVDFNIMSNADYVGTLYAVVAGDLMNLTPGLLPGSYILRGVTPVGKLGADAIPLAAALLIFPDDADSEPYPLFISFNQEFLIEDGTKAILLAQSYDVPPVLESLSDTSGVQPLYYSAFEMFANFIYGEGAELTSEQNMVMTILATSASLACVILPFLIVIGIARRCGL